MSVALPIADILVNAPASIVAAIGLWRLRRYGYLGGYFVAGFYLYASVFILVEAFTEQPPEFWAIVVPQVLAVAVALTLLFYLPRIRAQFR
jgi:ABC-type Na+ efflux pump permease subunit